MMRNVNNYRNNKRYNNKNNKLNLWNILTISSLLFSDRAFSSTMEMTESSNYLGV